MSDLKFRDCERYCECSPALFFSAFPDAMSLVSDDMLKDLLSDSSYVCRISKRSNHIEFGYPSDDWTIR